MATLLSGYTEKPESSPESATPQHLESTEPKNIHQVLEKTTSNVLAKPSALNVADTALETTETAHTIASNPRHDANTELNINSHNDEADSSDADSSLPPVDTGKDAWLFLLSAFILNVLVWSFPFAYGIFQEYYSSHPPFKGQRNIAIVGTFALGLMYLSSPLVFSLLAWRPTWKRPCILVGLIIMCLSIALSSLSTKVAHLIVSQGVFSAIGGALCYSPAINFMDEWFVKRKGMAFGMMWAGTGLGGVVIPLLLQFLLNKYGFRTTLRIWAVVLFAATAPLYVFLKPRVPISPATNHRAFNLSFLKTRTFLLHQLGNVLQGFGYFLPALYLPTYAKTLGASNSVSALTLTLINIAAGCGCMCMGWFVDHWHVTTCISITTIGSTLSVFLLWGFSTHLSLLMVFCFMYGLFAGCYSTTYSGVMKTLSHSQQAADSSMVFSVLVAGRGIGNVLSGPISQALIGAGEVGKVGVYGSEYGPLVIFTGVSAVLGGFSCIGRALKWF
ncbi:hypothetical protein ACJQWK_04314 [Exserohilum turcicum]|uniref:Major facilitator superfamily (MFS) profile domain-containing protein n=1 Tax=Exserohilum turcicum (strain 28A) TaxID=671987 RepID=R0IBZ1_EXST2|nr:uncharacterized protein SETTUDRAFT_165283 [Exserohilum turcica Et28A]EOA82920.1 hypothetical protein SETTUDRAFT_165283 [Exserohilum turcica Et28A]